MTDPHRLVVPPAANLNEPVDRAADAATQVGSSRLPEAPPSPPADNPAPVAMRADPQLAALFQEMRKSIEAVPEQIAERIGTQVAVIAALEAGAVELLPPWPETERIINNYTALVGISPLPILTHLSGLMVAAGPKAEPETQVETETGPPPELPLPPDASAGQAIRAEVLPPETDALSAADPAAAGAPHVPQSDSGAHDVRVVIAPAATLEPVTEAEPVVPAGLQAGKEAASLSSPSPASQPVPDPAVSLTDQLADMAGPIAPPDQHEDTPRPHSQFGPEDPYADPEASHANPFAFSVSPEPVAAPPAIGRDALVQAGFSHLANQQAPGALAAPEPEASNPAPIASLPPEQLHSPPPPVEQGLPFEPPPPPLIPEELLAADPDRAPGPQSASLGWRLFRVFYITVLLAAGAALVAWNML